MEWRRVPKGALVLHLDDGNHYKFMGINGDECHLYLLVNGEACEYTKAHKDDIKLVNFSDIAKAGAAFDDIPDSELQSHFK